jgi:spermidine/putrescine transport system permease protein
VSARARQAVLLLAPAVVLLVVLVGGSQVLMLAASLGRRSTYGGVIPGWSLQNYLRALEPLYIRVLVRSVVLAATTTIVCLAVGYPVAYWLARRAPPTMRRALLVLVILPFWTSFLVRMYAWMFLLRTEGLVNLAWAPWACALGLSTTRRRCCWARSTASCRSSSFPSTPRWKLDPALLDAAADLGAPRARCLRRVVLPLTWPGIVAGSILVFIPSLGAYLAPDLLGGARYVYVGSLIQSQFAVARDIPFGAALSFALSAGVLLVLWVFRRPLQAGSGESA